MIWGNLRDLGDLSPVFPNPVVGRIHVGRIHICPSDCKRVSAVDTGESTSRISGDHFAVAGYFGARQSSQHLLETDPGAAPILGILELLVISVGLPFLLLTQHDALSNANSVLGLLSSSVFLEPTFRLKIQSWISGAKRKNCRRSAPSTQKRPFV